MTFEDTFPGTWETNDEGTCWRLTRDFPLDARIGRFPLASLRAYDPRIAALLAREPRLATAGLRDLVFFDTETTGLGGAGTKIFLAGVGWLSDDGERFVVTQFLLRDYEEEPSLLRAVHAALSTRSVVVTYNGKRFDWPLLQERMILNRLRLPLPHAHYDALHPSRRLWRRVASDCSLATLERELLGHVRDVDVPGSLVPTLFFQWLHERDPRILVPVVEHNRHDVAALAALVALNQDVVASVAGGPAGHVPEDEVDWLSVGRIWNGAGEPDLALAAWARVANRAGSAAAGEAALASGFLWKRRGAPERAEEAWRSALESEEPAHRLAALEELAKHEEWRTRRPDTARGYAESALTLLDSFPSAPPALRARFRDRHDRLLRKSSIFPRA